MPPFTPRAHEHKGDHRHLEHVLQRKMLKNQQRKLSIKKQWPESGIIFPDALLLINIHHASLKVRSKGDLLQYICSRQFFLRSNKKGGLDHFQRFYDTQSEI